jgi:hypothetical protein
VRPIGLVEGGEAEKGRWVDTDQIAFRDLQTYRTLVLRRSPAQSRPPAAYDRVRHGDYYDVWQRPPALSEEVVERVPLGDFYQPTATPPCSQVLALAQLAGPGGTVAAVEREPNLVADFTSGRFSEDWLPTETRLLPTGEGAVRVKVDVPSPGRYDLFVQGSVRNPLTILIDGEEQGSIDYQLNGGDQFLSFGRARLSAGQHTFFLVLSGQSLAPGSGGPPEPIGPLVLSPASADDPPVSRLPVARAEELCGRNLDWMEAIR